MDKYKEAGVDIESGYKAVSLIKNMLKSTFSKNVLTDIGGFGGLFELSELNYKKPVLVSGTDGVGTKLKLAFKLNKHNSIGIDCVAMCVNDIICSGAKPLFFLDYIAVGKNNPEKIADIVSGIVAGCKEAECALIGGETAEMPGFYPENEYDLAGFVVGIVEKSKIIDGSNVEEGDTILGLASSGIHSNGYSLVRKVVDMNNLNEKINNESIGDLLLQPTKIYAKSILNIINKFQIKGIAHITGGGFIENIPRSFPDKFSAVIKLGSWDIPIIFKYIQEKGNLSTMEMLNIFNMGIGMTLIVKKEDAEMVMTELTNSGETVYKIGQITKRGTKQIWFE